MTEQEARDTLDGFEANLFHALYRSRWDAGHAAEVVPPLRQCLSCRDSETLHRSLSALRRIGPEAYEAKPEVLDMLGHPEPKVRECAVWALSAVCLRKPEDAVPHLVKAAEDPALRRPVMLALVDFGKGAKSSLPLFVHAFESPDHRCRLLAIRALKEIGPDFEEVQEVLRRGMMDRSKEVRRLVEKLVKSKWPNRYSELVSNRD